MARLTVATPTGDYEIVAERGLLGNAGAFTQALGGGRAAILTDSNVAPLYGQRLLDALRAAGVACTLVVVPAGEASKDLSVLPGLYGRLMDWGMTRQDAIIALGGGVVGDLAGYVAATLLRGVGFIQAPTTLLAQVDSSVGGKVAVNLPQGKNLVGAFHQPMRVVIDPDCLATLPPREIRCGLGEIIKHAAIADAALWRQLEQMDPAELIAQADALVVRNCAIKAGYVARDPYDTGVRMTLNFGHTLGHVLEKRAGYGHLSHGEAVAMGMVAACRWGEAWGVTQAGTTARMQAMLKRWGLDSRVPEGAERALAGQLGLDKKATCRGITLVLLEHIGRAALQPMAREDLRARLEGWPCGA